MAANGMHGYAPIFSHGLGTAPEGDLNRNGSFGSGETKQILKQRGRWRSTFGITQQQDGGWY